MSRQSDQTLAYQFWRRDGQPYTHLASHVSASADKIRARATALGFKRATMNSHALFTHGPCVTCLTPHAAEDLLPGWRCGSCSRGTDLAIEKALHRDRMVKRQLGLGRYKPLPEPVIFRNRSGAPYTFPTKSSGRRAG